MLAQLDKLPGVEAAMANRNGALVRVRIADASKAEEISAKVSEIFAAKGRKSKRLTDMLATIAIENEEWRDSSSIGELALIEARTIFSKRVEQFIEKSKLDSKTAQRLKELSQTVLEELPTGGNNQAKSADYRRRLHRRFLEVSSPVLTPEQLEQLRQHLETRVRA